MLINKALSHQVLLETHFSVLIFLFLHTAVHMSVVVSGHKTLRKYGLRG